MTCLFTRVICGESPKVNQRRWTKVGQPQIFHPSTPLITSVERNCLYGSLWLIQPCWSAWGTRVNAPLSFLKDTMCRLSWCCTLTSFCMTLSRVYLCVLQSGCNRFFIFFYVMLLCVWDTSANRIRTVSAGTKDKWVLTALCRICMSKMPFEKLTVAQPIKLQMFLKHQVSASWSWRPPVVTFWHILKNFFPTQNALLSAFAKSCESRRLARILSIKHRDLLKTDSFLNCWGLEFY